MHFLPLGTIQEINRLFRNFIWNRPDGSTSHALIGYDDMCFLYVEGGLGIRDLETVNIVAILKIRVFH